MVRSLSPLQRGVHIAFTGIDGAGKSTQAGLLSHYIRTKHGATYLSEPRTDLVSQLLHSLAHQHGRVGRREYFGNFTVDFSKSFDVVREHFSTIEPILVSGMHVIEPRSVYCRIATSIGMSGKRDKKIDHVFSLVPVPRLIIWLDVNPQIASERVRARGADIESLDSLQRFAKGYMKIKERNSWARIDGNASVEEVFLKVRKVVEAVRF